MALFSPPGMLNGVALSERTRWLLFAPVRALLHPKKFFTGPIGVIQEAGFARRMLRDGRDTRGVWRAKAFRLR